MFSWARNKFKIFLENIVAGKKSQKNLGSIFLRGKKHFFWAKNFNVLRPSDQSSVGFYCGHKRKQEEDRAQKLTCA